MNKLITKIVGAALGLTMAVGVGVAVGSNKEAVPVHATSSVSGTYNLVTSTTGIAAGDTVILVNHAGAKALTGISTTSTKYGTLADVTASNGTITLSNADVEELTVEDGAESGQFSFKGTGDISNYLYWTSGNSLNQNATKNAKTSWTLNSYSADNGMTIANCSTTTRVIRFNSDRFACYTTNTGTLVDLYKKAATTQTISGATSGYVGTGVELTTSATSSTAWTITANTAGATLSASTGKTITVNATQTGSVTVKATCSGYADATHTITFEEEPTDPFITPSKTSVTGVYTGQNETVSITYGNLTTGLAVSSGNTSVVDASIDYDDGNGNADIYLEFNGAGSTTISLKDGSTQLATISVSVTASSVTITGLASTGSVYIGKTTDLSTGVTVTAVGSYSNAVTWASDATDVATVSSAGVVTGVSAGTAHISVTSDDYPSATMSCTVTVSEAPLQYVMTFGATKNTNPTEIKTNDAYHSTYTSVDSDVVASDFSKIYGISSSQLKCGSGSASASISFTIPSSSYITSVVVVVATAGGTSMNVTSGATSAETENQTIAVGTLTFDDYLSSEKSNKVTLSSSATGAFYLTSITINYANFAPELHASSTSVEAAVNTSNQSINLTYDYFTPTSYTATVKSGTSLTAGAVAFSTSSTPHTATFTTGSSTGATVFTITGTGGGKSASVDVTVTVTEVRNLLTLTITTPSDTTSFKVGQSFDVGSLEITATFDAAPTTVVYSKANDNLGALTFAPAIGYTFIDADIGTITSVMVELELGTGDENVEYTIAVTDKSYAAQVTDVANLWDGQQIYFGASDGSRVNVVHAGGNQLTSQEANVHETKGLCLDDLEHSAAYTVHREKIDGVIYYSFQNGGYYLEASNTSNNYLTRTDTLSDNCRYTISISSGEVTMTNKGNSSRPEFRWNSGSSWFSQYQSGSSLDKAVIYAITSYSEEAVADAFVEQYLHMDESVSGQCNTYYPILKPVWSAMASLEKAAVTGAAYERLQAWAAAHGEMLDNDLNLVSNARTTLLLNIVSASNTYAIIIVVSLFSLTAIGGYFFIRKRKEQ